MASEKQPLPDWATPGATVLLEPGSYSRNRQFLEATVTRVTKTSVFVKASDGRERRFVQVDWLRETDRLIEYGYRGGYGRNTYIWNPEAPSIKEAKATAAKRAVEEAVAKAASDLAEVIHKAERPGQDYTTRIITLREALAKYEAANAHWVEGKAK